MMREIIIHIVFNGPDITVRSAADHKRGLTVSGMLDFQLRLDNGWMPPLPPPSYGSGAVNECRKVVVDVLPDFLIASSLFRTGSSSLSETGRLEWKFRIR